MNEHVYVGIAKHIKDISLPM